MQNSDAIKMLKRIRDYHDKLHTRAEGLGNFVGSAMPRIREIIHQLDELEPDEISEVDAL